MVRTLIHYRGIHAAVALGAAVAAAVLSGAILVGDSVRGSLTELTLDRLGRVDLALISERFFREALAEELAAGGASDAGTIAGAAPTIVARGSAVTASTGARASRIAIHGVDRRFTTLFGVGSPLDFSPAAGRMFPSVVINRSLQRELGVEPGHELLLTLGRTSDVPRETLLGETDAESVLARLRVQVAEVIDDRGLGRFGLTPSQQTPLNAFVDLAQLQRVLDQPGRVNALFAALPAEGAGDPDAVLRGAVTLDDLGLELLRTDDSFVLRSREFVLRPVVEQALRRVVAGLGLPLQTTQSYLANRIVAGDRLLPYSLVAALDPGSAPWNALELLDGSHAPVPGHRGVLLNRWAAEDLGVGVGDELSLTYFEVGPREELEETAVELVVEGVVAIRGLAADRSLTPDYAGIEEADDLADWDPPFPVDLRLIRDEDERYWDEYGATPKAFVSAATGRELWSTRFGSVTAARIGLDPQRGAADAEATLRDALLAALPQDALDMTFRPVRDEGLRASSGATDFAGLFAAFSVFLIVSAAMLVGLLFRLGVEQRGAEIGLLLALGYTVQAVRRRLLAEGLLIAAAGGLVGSFGGVGYAWLLMAGLRTLWRPAVGSSELYLHVQPLSLPLGWAISLAVVFFSIYLAVRRLVRLAPQRLLVGVVREERLRGSARLPRRTAVVALAAAAVLVAYALAGGATASPLLTFGVGSLLLVGALAVFAVWCRGSRGALARGRLVLVAMAARNSGWNPGRSILSVALVAAACFVIVTVAANREAEGHATSDRAAGAGGFDLVAEADVPLYRRLDLAEDRFELGFDDADGPRFDGVEIHPFRLLPGDDASCLNLYRPEKPRLLGVSPAFVRRDGFTFQAALPLEASASSASPWALLEQETEPGLVNVVADFNSAMWILKVGLGQELAIEDESGRPLRLRMAGLLAQSVFQSELLISEANFLKYFPSRSGDAYFLIDTGSPERVEPFSALLEQTLAPYGFDATTTAEKLAAYRAVERTYLSTFQILGGLGLLLGTIGLGVTLLRSVIERRGELATLRAFGYRRSRLGLLVLAENAYLLLVGVAVGTLSALAAAAPRLAEIDVPWLSLAATLGVVLLVGLLSSVAAIAGVLRLPLLPALKREI